MEKSAKKLSIIINGRSGVGKDTLIDYAARTYRVRNVSSVDRVKEIAKYAGWNGVKDDAGRQLLIDMKSALVKYGDLPTKYMMEAYNEFLKTDEQLLFFHIREIAEIEKLKKQIPCRTMLITRENAPRFNLSQDAELESHRGRYDIVFANDAPIDKSGKKFMGVIDEQFR